MSAVGSSRENKYLTEPNDSKQTDTLVSAPLDLQYD